MVSVLKWTYDLDDDLDQPSISAQWRQGNQHPHALAIDSIHLGFEGPTKSLHREMVVLISSYGGLTMDKGY